jgi:hypothetical protein
MNALPSVVSMKEEEGGGGRALRRKEKGEDQWMRESGGM